MQETKWGNSMLEDRLNDLEIKFTFQDELLGELNDIVTKQQFKIDALEKKVRELTAAANSNSLGNNENEKPPHY